MNSNFSLNKSGYPMTRRTVRRRRKKAQRQWKNKWDIKKVWETLLDGKNMKQGQNEKKKLSKRWTQTMPFLFSKIIVHRSSPCLGDFQLPLDVLPAKPYAPRIEAHFVVSRRTSCSVRWYPSQTKWQNTVLSSGQSRVPAVQSTSQWMSGWSPSATLPR